MKLFSNKMLLLAEQALSSAFNFLIIVILSRDSQEVVANFGLIYSFALVYIALLKNGALNIFLTSGSKSVSALNSLMSRVILSPVNALLIILSISIIIFWIKSPLLICVFFYYALIDVFRTYLIVMSRYFESLVVTISLVTSVIVMYYFHINILYSFSIVLGAVAIRYFVYSISDSENTEFSIPESINRESFIMTAAYTSYSHGPLWLLYMINPIQAAIFIQIRNIFQPAQVFSRVLDILEKKNSSNVGDYFLNFKVAFKKQLIQLTCVTLALAVFGYVFFDNLYGVVPDDMGYLFFFYSLICIGTFISRPIETYFYGTRQLTVLVRSRVVGTLTFAVVSPIVFFLQAEKSLLIMLIGLTVVWSTINILNIDKIYNLNGSSKV